MKNKVLIMGILLLIIFLSACGKRISVEEATAIAVNYVTEHTNEIWYVSQSKNENGQWVMHTKLFGYECLSKIIFINNRNGAILSVHSENDCKE